MSDRVSAGEPSSCSGDMYCTVPRIVPSTVIGRCAVTSVVSVDLRHTAASWMRMLGADIHTVATQLGHKDLRMAARYQHLSSDYMTAAVGRLDAAFGAVSEHEVEYSNEPSSRSIVPTASPQNNESRQEEQPRRDKPLTMLGLIGSDIGAR